MKRSKATATKRRLHLQREQLLWVSGGDGAPVPPPPTTGIDSGTGSPIKE